VSCQRALAQLRRILAVLGILFLSASCATFSRQLGGSSAYRTPAIVLAYPDAATTLPSDKPVVLLRFAPREADDPIDPRSFRATIDGVDRTTSFRVSDHEAWGTLASGAPNDLAEATTSGSHTLGVRVCSVRGACGALTVVLDVRPWDHAIPAVHTVRGADLVVPHLAFDASHATAPQRAVGGLAGA
jgi:hypothetical protein